MFGLTVLDLALILMLLSYLIYGLRNGFLVTVGGIAGFAAGAVAAFLSVPVVSDLVEDSSWRLTATIGVAVVLVVLGNALGTTIGRSIRSAVRLKPLRAVDRLIGGAMKSSIEHRPSIESNRHTARSTGSGRENARMSPTRQSTVVPSPIASSRAKRIISSHQSSPTAARPRRANALAWYPGPQPWSTTRVGGRPRCRRNTSIKKSTSESTLRLNTIS